MLGILGIFILPDNFRHLIEVEEKFHLCPTFVGILKKIQMLNKF
jgi:hypothetical protein